MTFINTLFFLLACGPKEGTVENPSSENPSSENPSSDNPSSDNPSSDNPSSDNPIIVPKSEEEGVEEITGPTETNGVISVDVWAQINLQSEYSNLEEALVFRARKLVIDAEGIVAQHVHQSRPGYAYIIQGEITEFRNDEDKPLVRRAGDISNESTGITHYWKNESEASVEALVVDILPPEGDLIPPKERVPKLNGPTQSIGIESVQVLGETPLDGEFAGLEGKQLRSRLFLLQPDAVIGQHTHNERSGFVYVVSGEIIEYRNDFDNPITHTTGSFIVEENGVEHYWENKSGAEVKLLSFDIFTPPE
jgi:quercetin dioxygenase-like cupin family protein